MKIIIIPALAAAALLAPSTAKAEEETTIGDIIDIKGTVNGTSQCAEDDEICKFLETAMDKELNDPDRSKRWKVAMPNILADDWDDMLRNMQSQAERVKVYGPFGERDLKNMKITYDINPEIKYSKTRLEKGFQEVSKLPYLKEMIIDASYYTDDVGDRMMLVSDVCLLLSDATKLEKLKIGPLYLKTQKEVDELALPFSKCVSLESVEIDQLVIGYRDVESLIPIVKALVDLPHKKEMDLALDAFDNVEATAKYGDELLSFLNNHVPTQLFILVRKSDLNNSVSRDSRNHHVLTNRKDAIDWIEQNNIKTEL